MNFRFRAHVSGHIDLPLNNLIEPWGVRFNEIGQQSDGSRDYIADFTIDQDSVTEAFRSGLSKAKRMADIFAYKSFSPVRLNPLSATLGKVKIGQAFPIAVHYQSIIWNCAALNSSNLNDAHLPEGLEVMDLISAFRAALSNEDQLASFVRCWAALEPELEKVAVLNNCFTEKTKCAKCGTDNGGGRPATQSVLQDLLNEASGQIGQSESGFDARKLRKIRGKIAHGADLGNPSFRKEFDGALPSLLSAIATHIWKSCGIKTAFQYRPVAFPDITQFSMAYTDRSKVSIDWSALGEVRTSITFIGVPAEATFSQESQFRIGLFEKQEYNGMFLPEIDA